VISFVGVATTGGMESPLAVVDDYLFYNNYFCCRRKIPFFSSFLCSDLKEKNDVFEVDLCARLKEILA